MWYTTLTPYLRRKIKVGVGKKACEGGKKEGGNIILNKQKKVTDITHIFFFNLFL